MSGNPSELTKPQLTELNAKLTDKSVSLEREIIELEAELTQQENEDQSAPDEVDRSSYEESVQRSQIVLVGKKNLLFEVQEALRRLADNTYGVCEETEEPIGFKRLAAQPWTRLSLEAQQDFEQRRKNRTPGSGGNGGSNYPSGFGE
ncbi:MAG: TraR/DksA family transcriptional regulator [Bdellovibrionota bacterium]